MIWHILISESVSVYGRYVVGLLSVWVRDCRSAVGLNSSTVLMIGFQSVLCRLSIGLKSGDSIPNLIRNVPDTNPTGFTVSSATLSVADSWPTHRKFCGFVGFVSVWPVWLPVALPSSDDQTGNQCYRHIQPSLKQGLNCRPGPCIGTAGAVSANRVPCTVGSQVPCKARPGRW